ncbi:MAG TPA: AMP-binding protein [Acidimicrobiales bacterium]|jgi:bile acid-coenzyme A ligase|nr:AMP-binding protein [Acidimicrobiales bacterium]
MAIVSFSRRLADLAAADPSRTAVTCGERSLTRAELETAADALARQLLADGVRFGDMVTIALPNSVDWFVAVVATWKIGAIPQPVSSRLPVRELAAIVELADPRVVLGVDAEAFPDRITRPVGYVAPPAASDAESLPDAISPAWKAPTSGGSTGRPKLIVAGQPGSTDSETPPLLLIQPDGCLMMPGPLYHNGPIVWSCTALLAGNHIVLLPRFDAEATLAGIEQHRADMAYMVPTMMKRIWRLPLDVRERYDLSSLRVVWHLAEPCPPWLKDAWIEWLGPDRIMELYAGTEAQTATIITGAEWLEHRGSVGRPLTGSVSITDEDGKEVAAGVEGEIWLKSGLDKPTYRYVGAEARTREGGWESLGDNGWLDQDGFLYLGDRTTDMILTGGANVYPAEVEAAIAEHPAVQSCAVIGLPDDDLGNIVHAIVEADPEELAVGELLTFLGERLVRYKVPRSVEIVAEPLRNDAGKVRRGVLRAERLESVAEPAG